MPLSGLRVLDLTRILSGPFCSVLLGDLGAEIIKVEPPGKGDAVRQQGIVKDGLSWYFANYNRNKRSLTLDLYTEEGRDILARLIARSDVLVENYRPGILAKMGFDHARLKALKPDLVYCNLNGYGTTGPYAARPAFDFVAQAMSGFMSLTGDAEDPPLRAGPPISDLVAGLYAALAILAAVMRRDRTGRGEAISVSLLSSLVSLLSFQASNFLANGELPARTGNDHTIVAPYGLFRTEDGKVAIAPSTEEFYQRLIEALELQELRQNPDFRTNELRVRNRAAINAAVEAKTQQRSTEHWIELLNAAGVPCGRVQNMREVFSDPQILDQEMLLSVNHPGHGAVSMLGFPMKFAEAPCRMRRPAPDLGADTDEILRMLGLTPDEVGALRDNGVV